MARRSAAVMMMMQRLRVPRTFDTKSCPERWSAGEEVRCRRREGWRSLLTCSALSGSELWRFSSGDDAMGEEQLVAAAFRGDCVAPLRPNPRLTCWGGVHGRVVRIWRGSATMLRNVHVGTVHRFHFRSSPSFVGILRLLQRRR